jgi:hypothetical protein
MNARRAALLAAAVVALMPVGVAAAAGPYPPPSSGSASVNPSRIKPGQCTNFSGDGFAPDTALSIADNDVPKTTTTSDKNGKFKIRMCYSTDASKGEHELSATGTGSQGDPLRVSAILTITGGEQSNPSTNGSQDVSAPGSSSTGSSSAAGGSTSAGAPGTANPGTTVTTLDASEAVPGSLPRTASGALAGGTSALPFLDLDGLAALGFMTALTALTVGLCMLLLVMERRRRQQREASLALA